MSAQEVNQSRAKLIALQAGIHPEEHLLINDICVMGRGPACDVVVPLPAVSRLHARIERQGTHFVLKDADSANGTFVNGKRIHDTYLLRNQDEIGLGDRRPLFRFNDLDATDLKPRRLHYIRREQRFVFNGISLDLSPNLTRLLTHLFANSGEICSRESCIQAIWNDAVYDPDRIGLLHKEISELRKKFREIDPQFDIIKTRQGLGYYLDIDQ